MKYAIAFVLLFVSSVAQAQIARITRDGTTVYSDEGQIYTPSEESIARQQEQQRLQQQQQRQQQQRLAEEQQRKAQNNAKQQQNLQEMQNNPVMQMSRSLIKSSGNQRKAFNLMIVQEVSTYKLSDEELIDDVAELRNNQEYYRKLDIIKKKLTNSKISDGKNKEVMQILNDAGNRLYNLLGN